VRGGRGDARRRHEVHRVLDPGRHLAVAPRLDLVGEARDPALHPVDVGVAAGREGAQEVQRGGGLGVGLKHAVRIGDARLGGEVEAVDDVAPVGGKLAPAYDLGRRRARLGELPGHAPDLDHRQLRAPGQHDRHLQKHLEGVADVVGRELREALRAIAPLQQERSAHGHLAQRALELARLAGEDQRRILGELRLDGGHRGRIGIVGHLHPRHPAPVGFHPALGHVGSPGLR